MERDQATALHGSGAGLGVGRALIVAAAVAAAVAMLAVDPEWAPHWLLWPLVGGVLVGAGALVNRVWATLLPLAYVIGVTAWSALTEGTGNPEYGEMTFWGVAILLAMMGAAVVLLLLLGVGIRRIARAVRR
jgi:hypothetical protein